MRWKRLEKPQYKYYIITILIQKKGDIKLKTFFGGIFIKKEKLQEAGIYHPIKLEYYKNINEDDITNNKAKFGISIIKTEYINENTKVEEKHIRYLTNDERQANNILKLFKDNEVTPIGADDVIQEYAKSILLA